MKSRILKRLAVVMALVVVQVLLFVLRIFWIYFQTKPAEIAWQGAPVILCFARA